MQKLKTLVPITRYVFGALFIASAALKLFPIDAFEMVLIKQADVSWGSAPFVARLIVISEFVIGLFIAFGFFARYSIMASVATLVGFSIFLINQITNGAGAENCGCFGELIPMDAPTSLGKNFIFLAVAAFLLGAHRNLKRWSFKWLPIPLIVIGVPVLFFLLPLPEANMNKEATIDSALIAEVNNLHNADLLEGDKVLVMLYAGCVHCLQLADLLSTAEDTSSIRVFVYGGSEAAQEFLEKGKIEHLPWFIAKSRRLMQAFNGTFPTIIQVSQGEVVSNWTGRDVNKNLLTKILAE